MIHVLVRLRLQPGPQRLVCELDHVKAIWFQHRRLFLDRTPAGLGSVPMMRLSSAFARLPQTHPTLLPLVEEMCSRWLVCVIPPCSADRKNKRLFPSHLHSSRVLTAAGARPIPLSTPSTTAQPKRRPLEGAKFQLRPVAVLVTSEPVYDRS